jgi:holo-[acyl-carrier protein] synthase
MTSRLKLHALPATDEVNTKMIIGIGVDIVEVAAVATSIREYGDRYLDRMFTPGEIQYCGSVPISIQRYAARIAAKEAAMKALSTGWERGVEWLDFEVVNEPTGQPRLLVHGTAAQLIKDRGITKIWLSLAHVREYAVAHVVFER